ncbi:MAG: SOS response-associated peptidase [Spirochaetes bacterium]|nr:SOS response-associated peptidase [Spirochaetota bacterium]
MCFNYSITKFQEYLEKRFQAKFESNGDFKPKYLIQAFSLPIAPVITNLQTDKIQLLNWGLIPFWVKDKIYAEKIRMSTFNARGDTIFEKPSFKNSIKNKRCIVLADGFFEWHENNGKKFPFYIKLKNSIEFCFAGIWDEWTDKNSNQSIKTYSIITTDANPMLKIIHNTKMRMPVILSRDNEKKWLSKLNKQEIINLLKPYNDKEMEAYSVSKMIVQKNISDSDPDILNEIKYSELDNLKFQ